MPRLLETFCMSCLAYALPTSFSREKMPAQTSLYLIFNTKVPGLVDNLSNKANKVQYLVQQGWVYLDAYTVDASGYQGVAFIHHEKKEIVLAHRGRVSLFQQQELILNAQCIIQILRGKEAALIPELIALISSLIEFIIAVEKRRKQAYGDYTIWQTGHSLGGFLAEVGAAFVFDPKPLFGVSWSLQEQDRQLLGGAKTFESLGSIAILQKLNIQTGLAQSEHYFLEPNIANTANLQDGTGYILLKNDGSGFNYSASAEHNIVVTDQEKHNISGVFSSMDTHSLDEILQRFDLNTHDAYLKRPILAWPIAINTFCKGEAPAKASGQEAYEDTLLNFFGALVYKATNGISHFSHLRTGDVVLA